MQKIIPNLWFDDQAEEAANFYVSIFKDSKITNVTRYAESAGGVSGKPKGSIMTVEFQLDGQDFVALNGGPEFKFSEAISLLVDCATQEEVDELWSKLTADGGEEGPCGWLKDKYGLSWQVVPSVLNAMLSDSDQSKVERVTEAFLQMKKLEIGELEEAYQGQRG